MQERFGIIGGLGPKATVDFINTVIDSTVAERDQDHAEFILLHHPAIPDRSAYIMNPSNPSPLPYLCHDVRMLSDLKVSFIVIPCNTAHYFYETLQSQTSVPIINMIRETVQTITQNFPDGKRIGILGTSGTLASNLYQNELRLAGLVPVMPPEKTQRRVNRLIFQQVKKGDAFDRTAYFHVLASMFELGCDRVILGCTELSLIEHEVKHHFPTVDAQVVLAEKTIQWSGKQVKPLNEQVHLVTNG